MKFAKYSAVFFITINSFVFLYAAETPAVDPYANPPSPSFAEQTQASGALQKSNFNVQVLMSDLQSPRSLIALPEGNMLVAEGAGIVRIINADGEISQALAGMPAIRSVNGRGLNDFVLDANFATNRRIYLAYQAPPPGESGGASSIQGRNEALAQGEVFQVDQVATALLSKDMSQLEQVEVLAEIAARRLVSASDGSLYITTAGYGDAGRLEVQDMSTLTGKILRINNDGSIPKDNPFYGDKNARQEIYAIGHRDPDGVFVHPESGELWTIEHGPMGGDELNLIKPGQNSGWPKVTYGKNYDGTEIAPATGAGTTQPRYYWFPSVAPAGLMVYTGALFPQWQDSFFLGAMSPTQGKFVVRLVMNGNTVVAEEHLLVEHDRRVRAVAQGSEGALYVLTDSESNDQTNRHFAGQVLKLTPSQ